MAEAPTTPPQTITIDTANVLHAAERDTRHGLAHLEDEFLAAWRAIPAFSETEAKKLLAWLASKL